VDWMDKDKLRRLLELIEVQGLGELRTLVFDKVFSDEWLANRCSQ
jgi:hypothetical protein